MNQQEMSGLTRLLDQYAEVLGERRKLREALEQLTADVFQPTTPKKRAAILVACRAALEATR